MCIVIDIFTFIHAFYCLWTFFRSGYHQYLIKVQKSAKATASHYHVVIYITLNNVTWHDDVIKWKHFPRYWPSVRGGNPPVTGEFPSQRPASQSLDVFFFICAWINHSVNNREAGDLRSHCAHYDVIVMSINASTFTGQSTACLKN